MTLLPQKCASMGGSSATSRISTRAINDFLPSHVRTSRLRYHCVRGDSNCGYHRGVGAEVARGTRLPAELLFAVNHFRFLG